MDTWILPKCMFDGIGPDASSLTIDFGGSALKILHLAKVNEVSDSVALDLYLFPLQRLNDALALMKNLMGARSSTSQEMTIHATGQTSNANVSMIQDRLDVKLKLLDEHECFCKALQSLIAHVPRHEMVIDPSEEVQREVDAAVTTMYEFAGTYSQISKTTLPLQDRSLEPGFWRTKVDSGDPTLSYGDACPGVYPFLLAMVGSAACYVKINDANSPPEFLDLNPRAGTSFLGMASLFTGISDFNKLMTMAQEGTSAAVNICMNDMPASDSSEAADIYNSLSRVQGGFCTFSWAKVIGKSLDEVKKEDLVRGHLTNTCHDIAEMAFYVAQRAGIHRVLVVGSFAQHPLVQFEIGKGFGHRRVNVPKYAATLEFVKYSSHLGALGALLKSL